MYTFSAAMRVSLFHYIYIYMLSSCKALVFDRLAAMARLGGPQRLCRFFHG